MTTYETAKPVLTDDELHEFATLNHQFENAEPGEIIRWAADRFGDGLVFTSSFEDAVLLHAIATSSPTTCSPKRGGSPVSSRSVLHSTFVLSVRWRTSSPTTFGKPTRRAAVQFAK
jgi:hypothetical protein